VVWLIWWFGLLMCDDFGFGDEEGGLYIRWRGKNTRDTVGVLRHFLEGSVESVLLFLGTVHGLVT